MMLTTSFTVSAEEQNESSVLESPGYGNEYSDQLGSRVNEMTAEEEQAAGITVPFSGQQMRTT